MSISLPNDISFPPTGSVDKAVGKAVKRGEKPAKANKYLLLDE